MILAARSPSSVQMACSSKGHDATPLTNYVRDEGRLCHSAKAPQTGAETVRGLAAASAESSHRHT